MNKQDIFHALCEITRDKQKVCQTELASVGKDRPTERGVLQLRAGIYNVAVAAGLMAGGTSSIETMCKRFPALIKRFPELASFYQSLPEEQKSKMATALYPEVFMRANFYKTYQTDLAEAEKSGDPQTLFKARIKKEVLDDILTMWRNFRVEHDLFVFAFENKERKQ